MAMHVPSGVTRPLLAGVTVLMLLSLAQAHGPAEWIQRGDYKNALGELCCGERDCFELTEADVKVTPAGYFVIATKETIPFAEATPSPPAPTGAATGAASGSASSRLQAAPELSSSPRVPPAGGARKPTGQAGARA